MPDWNEIVQDNARHVLNVAFRVLGNLADAEDVSQEVFTEAFSKWNSAPDQRWKGLLNRMAACRAIDLLRKRKEALGLPPALVDSSMSEPFEIAAASEMQNRLRLAIANLPPRQAEIFYLIFVERHSNAQVASLLGISRSAVATLLSKARSKLELIFREQCTGETK